DRPARRPGTSRRTERPSAVPAPPALPAHRGRRRFPRAARSSSSTGRPGALQSAARAREAPVPLALLRPPVAPRLWWCRPHVAVGSTDLVARLDRRHEEAAVADLARPCRRDNRLDRRVNQAV